MDTIAIKKFLSSILYRSGVTSLLLGKHRKSFIISYHHVLPEDDEMISFLQPGMYVTTKTFEQHIQYLTEHYKIIPLDQLNDLNEENTCIITFDDGWADNYHYAYPILRNYNVPATIFLSTNLIGTNKWPWPDRICYYIRNSELHEIEELINILNDHLNKRQFPDVISLNLIPKNRSIIIEHVIAILKDIPHVCIGNLMIEIDNYMRHQYVALSKIRPWLTWDSIQEMSLGGICFGAHTHNHLILKNIQRDYAEIEINLSFETIEKWLHQRPSCFSYPNGAYNEKIISILKHNGTTHAVTTRPGPICESESHLTLRRIMLHNDISITTPMFAWLIVSNTCELRSIFT